MRQLQAAQAVLAESAYNMDYLRCQIVQAEAMGVIQYKKTRVLSIEYNTEIHRQPNRIGLVINSLSRFQVVATHFDKCACQLLFDCCFNLILTVNAF